MLRNRGQNPRLRPRDVPYDDEPEAVPEYALAMKDKREARARGEKPLTLDEFRKAVAHRVKRSKRVMKAIPIKIGNEYFKSKDKATRRVQSILNNTEKYSAGDSLGEDDFLFIRSLLDLHSESAAKVGCGVASIQIQKNSTNPKYREFWITRKDGTRTEFSYIHCLESKSPEENAQMAMRNAVEPQIIAFRDSEFSGRQRVQCALSGKAVSSAESEVDHEIPFRKLVDDFLREEGIALGSVQVNATRDGETATLLADNEFCKRWCDFHQKHARLRIVTSEANRKRSRKT